MAPRVVLTTGSPASGPAGERLDVVMGFDDEYVRPACVLLHSLVAATARPRPALVVHVIPGPAPSR